MCKKAIREYRLFTLSINATVGGTVNTDDLLVTLG